MLTRGSGHLNNRFAPAWKIRGGKKTEICIHLPSQRPCCRMLNDCPFCRLHNRLYRAFSTISQREQHSISIRQCFPNPQLDSPRNIGSAKGSFKFIRSNQNSHLCLFQSLLGLQGCVFQPIEHLRNRNDLVASFFSQVVNY